MSAILNEVYSCKVFRSLSADKGKEIKEKLSEQRLTSVRLTLKLCLFEYKHKKTASFCQRSLS